MSGRIPSDAFNFYMGLGPQRSYLAVAKRYSVSKRGVTKHAIRERWQERLEQIESQVRDRSDRQIVDVLGEMNTRHLRTLKAIQHKALQALQSMPLYSAMNAVRALDLAIRQVEQQVRRVILREGKPQALEITLALQQKLLL